MESNSAIQKSDSEMSVSIRTPMEKKNQESEASEASSVSDLEISCSVQRTGKTAGFSPGWAVA